MKAIKSLINYCGIDLEGYQLPDGSYVLSQTNVASAIAKPNRSFIEFLQGKSSQALLYKESTFFDVDIEASIKPIKSIPIKAAIAYWTYWAAKGNAKACALVAAGAEETLTRLFDNAFGVRKTETQYQLETNVNSQQYELIFNMLSQVINQNSTVINQNQMLLARLDSVESELKILRPAYEELQTLNKSFKELSCLKELLEEIAKRIDNPNQRTKSLREWLAILGVSQSVTSQKCKAIGRTISDWLKIGNMSAPAKPAKYKESLLPLIKLATDYHIFYI